MLSLSLSSSSLFTKPTPKTPTFPHFPSLNPNFQSYPFHLSKNPSFSPKNLTFSPTFTPSKPQFTPKASGSDSDSDSYENPTPVEENEWLSKLPDKKKPLYAHSLPCIEAWLKSLGFYQSRDDRAVWFVENSDWHAHLSLDLTDLYIRYLRNGPGNLEKDMERRFSYALSREDIENAVLGGP